MKNDIAVGVLLKTLEESNNLARQAEDQRASMSNFLITIAAVMFAFIAQQGFAQSVIPVSLFMIFLGLFGLLMSAKYNQHYHRNYVRIRLIKKRIAELCPETQIEKIEQESSEQNRRRHPFLQRRVGTLSIWLVLHSAICLLGILSTILAII